MRKRPRHDGELASAMNVGRGGRNRGEPAGYGPHQRCAPGRERIERARPESTLKSRALRMLARREHSRAELARKLQPHAESAEQLDALLDRLVREGLLSNERFVESLVRRRAQSRGTAVIRHELREHQIDGELVAAHVAALERSEFARARALWSRRFAAVAAGEVVERARQSRFLLARGFSADIVRRVVAGTDDES